MSPLVAIIGPTAVGKSSLALHLAQTFDGEIVNADSRQVYRYMDIGTAKPSLEDRAAIPHHLIDIRDPDEEFSLALFLPLARSAIEDIQRRNRLPIVVGGTGQYIWALLEGWQVPQVAPDRRLRADLEAQARQRGTWVLYRWLQAVDPVAAQRIDPHNTRRVIRALEVHHAGGLQPARVQAKAPDQTRHVIVGLTAPRQEL